MPATTHAAAHGSVEKHTAYWQGLVVGQGMGLFPGSWQQTDTHCVVPVSGIVTVAVEVSLVPLPTSVPEAAPPSF
jgi:hypothetical protein